MKYFHVILVCIKNVRILNRKMNMQLKTLFLTGTIPESLSHQRLDVALAQLFPDYSRSQIQQWIRECAVSVNDTAITKTRFSVTQNQNIKINAVISSQGDWAAQAIPLDIIY